MKALSTPQSTSPKRNDRLKAYSLSAAAILASTAGAQVVYTDVDPDSTLAPNESFVFDFDGDGATDMVLAHTVTSFDAGGGVYVYGNFALAYGYGGGSFAGTSQVFGSNTFFFPQVYSAGQSIGSALGWQGSTAFGSMNYLSQVLGGSSTYSGGAFQNQTDAYLAVRFTAGGGTTHYAWIRLDVGTAGPANFITIKDYAFQSTPDDPIVAGDRGAPPSSVADPVLSEQINVTAAAGSTVVQIPEVLIGGTLEIFGMDGKLRFSNQLNSTQNVVQADLPQGLYVAAVRFEDSYAVRKFYQQ